MEASLQLDPVREALNQFTEDERRELLEELRRTYARQDLIAFCQYVDPRMAREYAAPHLRALAEKLEAVERGEIDRLYVGMPIRHWKTSLGTEKFVAWYLGRHPDHQVIVTGNTLGLTEKFSRTVRRIIGSKDPQFHEVFPECILSSDSTAVNEWSLAGAFRASYKAGATGSAIEGIGADLIVIDDPIKDFVQAHTRLERDKTYAWFRESLRGRLNPKGKIVLIMSPWDQDDLAFRLLKESRDGTIEHWESIIMPGLSGNPGDTLETLLKTGRPLWPDRIPIEELRNLCLGMGKRAFMARVMISPRVDDGNILSSAKLKRISMTRLPKMIKRVRRWDLAFSDFKGADYLAGALLGLGEDGRIYILDIIQLHGRWTQHFETIIRTAQQDGVNTVCAIESNGTQTGYFQMAKEHPRLANRMVLQDPANGSKEMRASTWGSRLEDDLIYCVEGMPWLGAFLDQMDEFGPNCAHDDMIDAVSGAYLILQGGGTGEFTTGPSLEERDDEEPVDVDRNDQERGSRRGTDL